MLNYRDMENEVRAGLENSKRRLLVARENLCYYNGDFDEYESYEILNRQNDHHSDRHSRLFNKVVQTLTSHLYKTPPARTVKGNPAATQFLQSVYKDNAMFAQWMSADRLSMVNEVACFQVAGTTDPKSPIKISLWDASQFSVFVDPDDPTKPVGVVTIDCWDNQRRLTLWTKQKVVVYVTGKWDASITSGVTAPRLISQIENPYGGTIPFTFVHFNYPTNDFWSGGPGDGLREANAYVNFRLMSSADSLRYMGDPRMVAEGVPASWTPPKPFLPGDIMNLPASYVDPMENVIKPSISLLQPDTGFVGASWDDISNYLDHVLEMHGIPEAAIRFTTSAGRSGFSIIAEQIPLILWAKGRQPQFAHYEANLAKLVFQVAVAHYNENGVSVPDLEKALEDFELSIRWAEVYPDLPGIERDRADDWLLSHSLTSRTQILMKRNSMTRDEAVAELKEIARDLQEEETLNLPPITAAPLTTTGDGSGGSQTESESDEDSVESAGDEE